MEAEGIAIPPAKELHELFDRADGNGNGQLSLAEIDKLIVEALPKLNHKPAIMRAYKAADRDGSGLIKRSEFPFFIRFLTYYNHLWQEFELAGGADDRRISRDEFVRAAPKLGIEGNPNAVFDTIDENRGGFILFDEYCSWRANNHTHGAAIGATHSGGAAHPPAHPIAQPLTHDHARTAGGHVHVALPVVAVPSDAAMQAEGGTAVPSIKELHDLFDRADVNGNGQLSLAEIDKLIVEALPKLNHKPAIMRAYKAADRDGSGWVQRSEFPFLIRFLTYYNGLWQEFELAGGSDDRRISRDEFVRAAPKLGIEGNPNAVFDTIDENRGGFILFDEFCSWRAKNHIHVHAS